MAMVAQSARLLVYFLTAAWLAVENEYIALASTTLSLRLIHRFLDEVVKALKFSPLETNGSAGVSPLLPFSLVAGFYNR